MRLPGLPSPDLVGAEPFDQLRLARVAGQGDPFANVEPTPPEAGTVEPRGQLQVHRSVPVRIVSSQGHGLSSPCRNPRVRESIGCGRETLYCLPLPSRGRSDRNGGRTFPSNPRSDRVQAPRRTRATARASCLRRPSGVPPSSPGDSRPVRAPATAIRLPCVPPLRGAPRNIASSSR